MTAEAKLEELARKISVDELDADSPHWREWRDPEEDHRTVEELLVEIASRDDPRIAALYKQIVAQSRWWAFV